MTMKKKKVLFLKAQWLWDMISWIPKLVELKEQWYEVYQSFYDVKYLTFRASKRIKELVKNMPMFTQWWHFVLELYQKSWLINHILKIPFGLLPMICFIIKNFKKFDEIIIPIRTKTWIRMWRLLWKKSHYIFEWGNDTTKYPNTIQWELWHSIDSLYDYKNYVKREEEAISLPEKYIVIFPSLLERSLLTTEWIKIINYIYNQKIDVLILWWEREKWFLDILKKEWMITKISDYLWKTTFKQLVYTLKRSKSNILCNGWLMWLGNLVNKNNINIHTVSAFLMQPDVDDIHSFNIRPYTYPHCIPCEAASLPQSDRIPQCVFYNTVKEWACRKAITSEMIIKHLQKIL